MNLHAIGIDLGKTVFHLVGLNHSGEVQVRKKFSRNGRTRRSTNPNSEEALRDCVISEEALRDCVIYGERSAAHSILARSTTPTKAEYICADQTVTLRFRLQYDGGPYIPEWSPTLSYPVCRPCSTGLRKSKR